MLAAVSVLGKVRDVDLQGPVKVQDPGAARRPGKTKCTDDWRTVVAAGGDVGVERGGGEAEILRRRRARAAAAAA